MRTKLVLALAILMGAVTTVLFYQYISQFQQEASVVEEFVEVVAAKEPIAENERIAEVKLTTARVPKTGLHPNAVSDLSDAVGKLATSEIASGEVLLSHRLADEHKESVFVSRKVREGYRAISIGVNFVQSVSNLIEPEDQVDVFVTRQNPTTHEFRTDLLLSDVRVLAVGRKMVESVDGTDYVEYSAATLEVKPEQLIQVVHAVESGRLHLALHTRVNREQPQSAKQNPASSQ